MKNECKRGVFKITKVVVVTITHYDWGCLVYRCTLLVLNQKLYCIYCICKYLATLSHTYVINNSPLRQVDLRAKTDYV